MAASGVMIKASGIVNTRDYIRNTYGDETLNTILNRMPEDSRNAMKMALAPSKYPIEYVGDLMEAVRGVLKNEGPEINYRIANESIKTTFSIIYKIFFKLGDPQFIIKKAASVWSSVCFGGELAIVDKGDKYVVARLTEFNYKNPEYCGQRLRGWMQAPLELSGCRITENVHTYCICKGDPYCEWKISWR